MFVVTEADAAAIRAVYQQRGEFSAAVELRRRFPGITDNAQARECARTIAGWCQVPLRSVKHIALDYKVSPNRVWGKLAGAEPMTDLERPRSNTTAGPPERVPAGA